MGLGYNYLWWYYNLPINLAGDFTMMIELCMQTGAIIIIKHLEEEE